MAYTTIDKPTDYFNTITYSGNGSTQSITGVNFQPDWVWIKARSGGTQSNNLYDSVRGATKYLRSDSTIAEGTQSNGLTSFDSDGFSMGNDNGNNGSGYTYVSWNWLAGGTASSNTDGSITSSVSANTTAGFSIVSYTGNGSDGATVGHGLGVTPSCIIFKNRSDVQYWVVYHKDLGGANNHLRLDGTAAKRNDLNMFSSTAPTSSLFEIGTQPQVNGNTHNIIAYCFAEKKGYSKFGTYTGNGSSDGSYIHLGFKPAFVILKRTDSSGFQWVLSDGVRDPDNAVEKYLHPSTSDPEQTGSRDIDFLSNGIKIRNSNTTWNASGGSYIYMCFSENPFVTSTAIPTTAR